MWEPLIFMLLGWFSETIYNLGIAHLIIYNVQNDIEMMVCHIEECLPNECYVC